MEQLAIEAIQAFNKKYEDRGCSFFVEHDYLIIIIKIPTFGDNLKQHWYRCETA